MERLAFGAGHLIVSARCQVPDARRQEEQTTEGTEENRNTRVAARGSKLDRHEQIGKGSIGLEAFRRLLNDPRLAAAFISETPMEKPGDDRRNVERLKRLVSRLS